MAERHTIETYGHTIARRRRRRHAWPILLFALVPVVIPLLQLQREYHEDAVDKLNALKSLSAIGTIAMRLDKQCFILSFRIGMTAQFGLNQGHPDPFNEKS